MELLLILLFVFIFTFISYKMAESRGRDGVVYALIGLLTSPVVIWVILLVIGDTEEKRKEKADFKAFKENCL